MASTGMNRFTWSKLTHLKRNAILAAALATGVIACATTEKPAVDPIAEAAAAKRARQKRLVVLLRAGDYDVPGPSREEMFRLVSALTKLDPEENPREFRAAFEPTLYEAARRHDPALYQVMLVHRCRTHQKEALAGLLELRALEEKFRDEEEHYGTLADIGFEQPSQRYEISLESVDDISFVAIARGRGDAEGDLWRISHGHLEAEALVDRCSETEL